MKTSRKKLSLQVTPLFSFKQQASGHQRPSDTTLTITVTGDTIFTWLGKKP